MATKWWTDKQNVLEPRSGMLLAMKHNKAQTQATTRMETWCQGKQATHERLNSRRSHFYKMSRTNTSTGTERQVAAGGWKKGKQGKTLRGYKGFWGCRNGLILGSSDGWTTLNIKNQQAGCTHLRSERYSMRIKSQYLFICLWWDVTCGFGGRKGDPVHSAVSGFLPQGAVLYNKWSATWGRPASDWEGNSTGRDQKESNCAHIWKNIPQPRANCNKGGISISRCDFWVLLHFQFLAQEGVNSLCVCVCV